MLRDGKRLQLAMTAEEQPKDYDRLASMERGGYTRGQVSRFEELGFEVSPLTSEVAQQLGIKAGEGAVVTNVQPNSPADQQGLVPGMVIIQANRKPVKTVEELKKAMEAQPLDKGVLLLVRTAEGSRFVVLHAEK